MAALAVFTLQQSLMHRFSAGHIGFDLIALLAAFVALAATAKSALWAGLFLGMLRDFGSTGRLGASALAILPAVMLVWALKERFHRATLVSDVTLTFLFILCFGFLHAAGMLVFSSRGVSAAYLNHAAGRAAFTCLLAPPFFALFRLAGIIEVQKTVF